MRKCKGYPRITYRSNPCAPLCCLNLAASGSTSNRVVTRDIFTRLFILYPPTLQIKNKCVGVRFFYLNQRIKYFVHKILSPKRAYNSACLNFHV